MIFDIPNKNISDVSHDTLLAWIILTYSKIMVSKPSLFT